MRKTNRARLESLVLINWKGFFYQRFEMDVGVTALEGENGSGKTTVMIGAFVALLPDQRLLQFRNVSETGGMEGDRGIFGRLGSRGVAYSVMELHVPRNGRMLAGVMLRKKGPPSLEFTPFIAGGLTNDHALDEILLVRDGETERVPELTEIRQKLGQIGCTLDVFDSVGQYTSKLFDLGISPMSMEAYAERDKFNRILQTSMYGGLSSSIQKGLRDYLLAEDTSLRNHVARMRENLDACRVTRQEIESAERKYKMIEGIFRSGYGMFESAFHGTRLRVVGSRKRAENSRGEHFRCKLKLKELASLLRELEHTHSELKLELKEREEEYERAENLLRDCREARKTALKIERHSAACLMAKQELEQSEELFRSTEKRFRKIEWTRDQLVAERDQIALGLSDASKAWEQVSMKVALLKQAQQTLEDARNALPDREVSGDSAADLLAECIEQWNRALEDKSRVQKELDSLNTRIRSYEEVLDALRNGLHRQVTPERALEAAREFDANFREMERLTKEAEVLPERIENTRRIAERQQAVRQKLASLERKGEKVESAAGLRSLFEMMQSEQDSLAEERSTLQERQAGLREERAKGQQQLERLESEALEWRQARILIHKLEDAFEVAIEETRSFESLEHRIRADLETTRGRLRSLSDEHESTQEKVSELEFGGGRLDESLVPLRDLVDGRLAVELYDDTPEVDAPMIEARLGPLHGALLVDDIPEAVGKISREPDFPDHVWLMEAGALKEVPEGKPYPASELVKMGDCWRLSRHPERPVVGRAAREREIERLKVHANTLRAEIETVRTREARFLEGIETTGKLRQYYRLIGLPDPSDPVIRLQKRIREIQGEELLVNRRLTEINQRHRHCRRVLESLAKCLPDADLLDQDDWFETVVALKTQLKEADTIKSRMEAVRSVIQRVRTGMFDLEYPPPGPDEVHSHTEAGKRADAVLEYWSKGRELLGTLVDRLPHLQFRDQEKLLIEQKSALKALEDKKIEVDQAYQAAKAEVDQAGQDYEQVREQLNSADAKYKALHEKIENLRQELVESGQDGTKQSLEESEAFKEEATKKLKSAQEAEREIGNDLIRAEKDMEMGKDRTSEVRDRRKKDIEDLWPHWRTWMNLRQRVMREGFLDRLIDPQVLQSFDQKNVPRVFEDASKHQGELKNILRAIPEGDVLWQEVERLAEAPDADLKRGAQNLEVWIMIRRFLERSIPRDIAQADDPEIALKQIGDHLMTLKGRLDDQQRQLRQRSDTVANSIRTRIRKEERQIHQLNKRLEAVSFGTISGIRIHLERVESMQRLLDGLQVQKDLFNSQTSLEEAMTELYRQVGGGAVRGDQLLDYREYVRMSVEVQRLGSDKWTKASSNTLSTGESIGVGAAVLMVILDAWEHQAVLLRGKRDGGSLRFLFLDEAARLSPKSLDTLGEFCERMDLQFLVAAPAADRARRGTAYRLVRLLDEEGAEEVVVRGRRFTGQTVDA